MTQAFIDIATQIQGNLTRYWGIQAGTGNNTQGGTTADVLGTWRLYYPATTTIDSWIFTYFVRGSNTPSSENVPLYLIEGDNAGNISTTTLGNVKFNVAPGNFITTYGTNTPAIIEAGHWVRVGFVSPAMATPATAAGGMSVVLHEQIATSSEGTLTQEQFDTYLSSSMENTISAITVIAGAFVFLATFAILVFSFKNRK